MRGASDPIKKIRKEVEGILQSRGMISEDIFTAEEIQEACRIAQDEMGLIDDMGEPVKIKSGGIQRR